MATTRPCVGGSLMLKKGGGARRQEEGRCQRVHTERGPNFKHTMTNVLKALWVKCATFISLPAIRSVCFLTLCHTGFLKLSAPCPHFSHETSKLQDTWFTSFQCQCFLWKLLLNYTTSLLFSRCVCWKPVCNLTVKYIFTLLRLVVKVALV